MTEEALISFLRENYPQENESCEWKLFCNLTHNISSHKGEDVISYVSAIANMEGGQLILGVKDQTLEIEGIQCFHNYTAQNLPHRLLGNCTNLNSEGLKVEEFVTSDTDKTVWIIRIPKHLPRKPVFAHKTAWQRKGDSLIPITHEREQSILHEPIGKTVDWSAGILSEATLEDIDPNALAKAKQNYISKFPALAQEASGWDDLTFLNKVKLAIKGKLTRTAILLLGKPESENFVNPAEAKIRWVLKDSKGYERDYEIFTLPLLLKVDEVYAKIRNLKYRYIREYSLFPEEVDMYEPYLIREALNNCIAHQDYEKGGRINVVEFDDRLVFSNVGSFIPGSVEKVIEQDAPEETYRNPFLVAAMFNLKMVDTIGSGIRRMFDYQRQRFFPLPEYDFSDGKVKVTITGKVLDMDYARTLAKNPDLNIEEIILLDKVQKKKAITEAEAVLLKNKQLIEGRKPNYHISAQVAAYTGTKAEYIKNKAFDDDHYKKMILSFIEKYFSASRKDIDGLLLAKLPDVLNEEQKMYKIGNLLSSLRIDGVIQNIGTRSKPRWVKRNS